MLETVDPRFYQRADDYIQVANTQMRTVNPQRVSASFLWGAAHYTSWMNVQLSESKAEMEAKRQEAIDFYTDQFRQLLSEQYDRYLQEYEVTKDPGK